MSACESVPAAPSGLRQIAKTLAGWTRPRPGVAPGGTRTQLRVQATPPTETSTTLSGLLAGIIEDVDAVLQNDPAARNALEVLTVYPGLHALWMHRVAHGMWRRGYVLVPRWLSHFNRGITGIEIHPGARVGRRVFIDHGMGIVIGETATVGDDCLLYKGVVLGGTSLERAERHPTLGRGVVVGTNASVLGPIHIGDNARVGSNSVVIRDVPEGSTVVGVPGRVAKEKRPLRAQLDHADLPDPVTQVLSALLDELEALRERIAQLEGKAPVLQGRDSEHDRFDGEKA